MATKIRERNSGSLSYKQEKIAIAAQQLGLVLKTLDETLRQEQQAVAKLSTVLYSSSVSEAGASSISNQDLEDKRNERSLIVIQQITELRLLQKLYQRLSTAMGDVRFKQFLEWLSELNYEQLHKASSSFALYLQEERQYCERMQDFAGGETLRVVLREKELIAQAEKSPVPLVREFAGGVKEFTGEASEDDEDQVAADAAADTPLLLRPVPTAAEPLAKFAPLFAAAADFSIVPPPPPFPPPVLSQVTTPSLPLRSPTPAPFAPPQSIVGSVERLAKPVAQRAASPMPPLPPSPPTLPRAASPNLRR